MPSEPAQMLAYQMDTRHAGDGRRGGRRGVLPFCEHSSGRGRHERCQHGKAQQPFQSKHLFFVGGAEIVEKRWEIRTAAAGGTNVACASGRRGSDERTQGREARGRRTKKQSPADKKRRKPVATRREWRGESRASAPMI